MKERPRKNHDELVRRAQDALEREDFDEAEALGRRALMLDADSLDARQVVSSSLIEQGRYEESVPLLEEILAREPDDLIALADMGLALFEMSAFEDAEAVLSRALEIDNTDPQSCYWMALCLERRAEYDHADHYFQTAHQQGPDDYPLPTRIPRDEFDRILQQALAELPEDIRRELKNLAVIVEDLPREEDLTEFDPPLDPCLYGLYVGIPLPERTTSDAPHLPDQIFLYKRNLERMCAERDSLVQEIRITLLHEVGHYLGFDEDDLAQRGLA
jgi:predicted Zn-dependent protease with MMP-like domain